MSLVKSQMVVILRNGIEVWLDQDKAEKLQAILKEINGSKFISFEGQTFNTADITGVFTPQTMNELGAKKRGEWVCEQGYRHSKEEKACHGHQKIEPIKIDYPERTKMNPKLREQFMPRRRDLA